MKKILMYIDSMKYGGAERVMSILANSFAKKGYEVTLVTDIAIKGTDDEYKICDGVKCVTLVTKYSNIFLKNIDRLIKLRKIIKNSGCNIVLSFLGNQNLRMIFATKGIKCKKYISVRNDPRQEYGKNILKNILSKYMFKKVNGCIFQTIDAKDYFGKKIQKKSIVIPNPIDEKFFKENQVNNPHNIIAVGRLEKQKNHKLLIDAYSRLSDTRDKLFIFGDGSLKNELKKYIMEKKLQGRVFLKGNTDKIENEIKKSKLYVLSSDYEGMPNSLMEAMAVGIPCVSTDCPCGGPKFLIKNSQNGYLTKCNDEVELSKIISMVLCEKNSSIGCNAKKSVEKFNTKNIVKIWDDYLI